MALSSLVLRIASMLRSGLRYGESKRSWKSRRLPGKSESTEAILLIGGLSSNSAASNRTLAEQLSNGEVLTWSRNLYGHTGRFSDFSRSRFWHWLADGIVALRKLVIRFNKSRVILIGHSTGGLVVLGILILRRLLSKRSTIKAAHVQIRGVLIFPPFRLQRRLDARLLWVVAIMYYIVCPSAFVMLALSGPWMWPLSLLAFALHLYFVPKISVPSGDERVRQPEKKRRWAIASESIFLALLCIYFVVAPPLIALFAQLFPGPLAIGAFGCFIATLIAPLFLIPRKVTDVVIEAAQDESGAARHHLGYRWLPVITVANLMLLQFILRRFLGFCTVKVLIIEGGQDKVVVVEPAWIRAMGENVEVIHVDDLPHSDLTPEQQTKLAVIIRNWLAINSGDPVNRLVVERD